VYCVCYYEIAHKNLEGMRENIGLDHTRRKINLRITLLIDEDVMHCNTLQHTATHLGITLLIDEDAMHPSERRVASERFFVLA